MSATDRGESVPGVGPAARAGGPAARATDPWGPVIVAAFAVVVGASIWHHEMWRDEMQVWTIVRGSGSIGDLLHNLRYEGHPLAWYVPLLGLSKLTRAPEAMQAFQWAIATATVAVVVWRSPFSRVQQALLAGSYFLAYEYGVLARSYSLGALSLVVVCALGARPRRPWPWIGLVLALLALTSAFGAVLAGAVLAGLLVDEGLRHRTARADAAPLVPLGLGTALAVLGVVAAYVQTRPPGDSGIHRGWRLSVDPAVASSATSAVWHALVPVPELTREFWNTTLLDGPDSVTALLSVALLAAIAWNLRRRPGAAVVWVAGAVGAVGFLYLKFDFFDAGRFAGHVFLALVAAAWLAPSCATLRPGDRPGRDDRVRRVGLTALLAVQAVAAVAAISIDLRVPFSNGEQIALYVEDHGLSDATIVGVADAPSSVVAGYLDRPVYYPAGDRQGTFIVYDTAREQPTRPLAEVVADLRAGRSGPLLVLSTRALPTTGVRLRLLTAATDGVLADEHFWLYEYVPRR